MIRFQGNVFCAAAVMLHQHIVADRVYKRAQAVRVLNSTLGSERLDDPDEGLLLEVVDDFGRQMPCAQLDLDEPGEIVNKMAFRRRIALTEPYHIGFVKCK